MFPDVSVHLSSNGGLRRLLKMAVLSILLLGVVGGVAKVLWGQMAERLFKSPRVTGRAGQALRVGQNERHLRNTCVPREKPGTSRKVLLGQKGAECLGKGRTRADGRAHCVSEVVSSPFYR